MSDGPSVGDPRRERLLQSVVGAVAQTGYQATTIADITAGAGVSRTTFYEYFADRQDCFLCAYRGLAGRLLVMADRALEETPGVNGTRAIVGVLVELAVRDPASAVFLTHGAAAAGLAALQERDRLLAGIERAVERAWEDAPRSTASPRLAARVLVGATVRELAVRLHRGEPPGELLGELAGWAGRYAQRTPPAWRSGGLPKPAGANAGDPRSPTRRAPARLTAHERIVRATAELARREGHPNVTVAGIAAAAGVNRETFYQHFSDRQSAYIAAIQLAFERTMAATAVKFFGRPDWADRVWSGTNGLVEFLAEERALAHIALGEPYAVGPEATELIIDLQLAFTLFLEEGYRLPGAERTPRVTSTLMVGGVLELLDRRLREHPEGSLAALVPEIAYVALAPFTGADAASEFIQRKIDEAGRANP